MTTHLTAGQHALLEADLLALQAKLEARLSQQLEGQSRVDHAHHLLAEDDDAVTRHADEREVDLALADQETTELGEVCRALARLRDGPYGRCADCGCDIPFDRLKVEPQAERCVPCANRREQVAGR